MPGGSWHPSQPRISKGSCLPLFSVGIPPFSKFTWDTCDSLSTTKALGVWGFVVDQCHGDPTLCLSAHLTIVFFTHNKFSFQVPSDPHSCVPSHLYDLHPHLPALPVSPSQRLWTFQLVTALTSFISRPWPPFPVFSFSFGNSSEISKLRYSSRFLGFGPLLTHIRPFPGVRELGLPVKVWSEGGCSAFGLTKAPSPHQEQGDSHSLGNASKVLQNSTSFRRNIAAGTKQAALCRTAFAAEGKAVCVFFSVWKMLRICLEKCCWQILILNLYLRSEISHQSYFSWTLLAIRERRRSYKTSSHVPTLIF